MEEGERGELDEGEAVWRVIVVVGGGEALICGELRGVGSRE